MYFYLILFLILVVFVGKTAAIAAFMNYGIMLVVLFAFFGIIKAICNIGVLFDKISDTNKSWKEKGWW